MTSGYKLIILALVVGLGYPALQVAAGEPAVYKVFVDEYYGFKRVIEINYTPFAYENLTLNIKTGDSVIWANDASDNSAETIVSEQNLWDNTSGYLRYNYRTFEYTFNQPGTYGVYMKEHPRIHHQTIVVAPVETPTPTPTEIPTATPTATVVETPVQAASPGINLWYILVAVIVIAGIVLLRYSGKKG